jgi:hypothetical protein
VLRSDARPGGANSLWTSGSSGFPRTSAKGNDPPSTYGEMITDVLSLAPPRAANQSFCNVKVCSPIISQIPGFTDTDCFNIASISSYSRVTARSALAAPT